MPCDMAMKWPRPRIHRIVLHNHIPLRLQQLHVPPLRVPRIDHGTPVPLAHTLTQHVHIVTMEMHRMCGASGVLYDEADGGVSSRVVDVPLRVVGVGRVARFREEEERGIVVSAEGDVVDAPEEVAGAVDSDADGEGYGCGGVGSGGDGVEGGCFRECILCVEISI